MGGNFIFSCLVAVSSLRVRASRHSTSCSSSLAQSRTTAGWPPRVAVFDSDSRLTADEPVADDGELGAVISGTRGVDGCSARAACERGTRRGTRAQHHAPRTGKGASAEATASFVPRQRVFGAALLATARPSAFTFEA
jgi:hypothetical protein